MCNSPNTTLCCHSLLDDWLQLFHFWRWLASCSHLQNTGTLGTLPFSLSNGLGELRAAELVTATIPEESWPQARCFPMICSLLSSFSIISSLAWVSLWFTRFGGSSGSFENELLSLSNKIINWRSWSDYHFIRWPSFMKVHMEAHPRERSSLPSKSILPAVNAASEASVAAR